MFTAAAEFSKIKEKREKLDFETPTAALVVSRENDPSADAYSSQSAALLAGLGGMASPKPARTTENLPECPGVTILAGIADRRNPLLIYGNWDNGAHFVNQESPSSPMEFRNALPQGNALKNVINTLTDDGPVNGVTLATPRTAIGLGANTRLKAVMDVLVAAGRQAPAAGRQVSALSGHDCKQLSAADHTSDDFEDIIFFESNLG